MSSAHSMNARKCVHEQKAPLFQAIVHESSKVGGREKNQARSEEGKKERQERQRPGG